MKLPTKSLISKIESLSQQMTSEQLRDFLDVLDSMAIMVEEAKAMPTKSEGRRPSGIKLALH